jgi:hypothetical protein
MPMQVRTPPRKPVEDWEAKRDEWVAAVEQIAADAEAWAKEQQWLVHRDRKTMTEDMIGAYDVPVLTIQAPAGRLILDPIAQSIVGALGRIDLCAFPSYEKVLIVRTEDGWQFVINPPVPDRPWSKEAFLEISSGLAAKA